MSADDWKRLVDVFGLLLLGAAFLLGIASFKIGNVIGRRDAKNQALLEERTALAEKATEEMRSENIQRDERLVASQKEVALLQTSAADSRATQQRVEIELNTQKERTAMAELELLKVQERIKPRHFSDADRERLKAFLMVNPKGNVQVFVSTGPESANFGGEIVSLLKESGWNITASGPYFSQGGLIPGLILEVKDGQRAPIRVKSLADAFHLVGFVSTLVQNDGLEPLDVVMRVGPKE